MYVMMHLGNQMSSVSYSCRRWLCVEFSYYFENPSEMDISATISAYNLDCSAEEDKLSSPLALLAASAPAFLPNTAPAVSPLPPG
jgi:hypothetical protein